jgi:hypothetical protein
LSNLAAGRLPIFEPLLADAALDQDQNEAARRDDGKKWPAL